MYSLRKRRLSRWQIYVLLLFATLTVVVGGIFLVRNWYENNLQPVSNQSAKVYFTIESGESLQDIAASLKNASLIRSATAFEGYVRSKELYNRLQAGTYSLSPSMSVKQIVDKLTGGDIVRNLLTILPGKRLDQIKKAFSDAGYSPAAIAKAFNPDTYFNHPALASLPPGATLEGYLYPDSFEKVTTTPAENIIRASLGEMAKHLTSSLIAKFQSQDLSIHQAVILASIVEREASKPSDRTIIAQVFLKRLALDIKLESDATAVGRGQDYNTYQHEGLPPGPISNVSGTSLQAVAEPATTDYLFFVAGDDGVVRFSDTKEQHNELVDKYCHEKCGR